MQFKVYIPESIYDALITIRDSSNVEECGIFIGRFDIYHTEITEIIRDYIRKEKTAMSSIRYTKGIYSKYQDYINSNFNSDYIGEWHTHVKGSSNPSILDDIAMKKLLKHPDYSYPDKLVLGIVSSSDQIKIFLYSKKFFSVNKKLTKLKFTNSK